MPIFSGTMLRQIAQILTVAGMAAGFALPAAAGSGLPAKDEIAEFRVLPGWRTNDGRHFAALHVRLDTGWKTYWRAPGDAGIPPQFDWRGSRNLAAVRVHWPVPHVFAQNGMRAIGYAGELVLPLELTPKGPGPIRLSADLDLGVCQDICMPMSVRLSADLPQGGAPDATIRGALADRPATAGEAGVASVRCTIDPIDDGLRVSARIDMPALRGDEVAVFELPDHGIWISEAHTARSGARLEAVAEMVPPENRPFFLNRSDVRITIIGAGEAVDIRGCPG
jgi:DsbC/DsbD-like thiol-disulfide interchange protein